MNKFIAYIISIIIKGVIIIVVIFIKVNFFIGFEINIFKYVKDVMMEEEIIIIGIIMGVVVIIFAIIINLIINIEEGGNLIMFIVVKIVFIEFVVDDLIEVFKDFVKVVKIIMDVVI